MHAFPSPPCLRIFGQAHTLLDDLLTRALNRSASLASLASPKSLSTTATSL